MTQFEGHFHGVGRAELFFQSWQTENAIGSVIITHGMSEHTDCYQTLAKDLCAEGWNVFAWDLRGHGRSEGKRGYVADFNEYHQDLNCFVQFLQTEKQSNFNEPFLLFGHSMGGLITLAAVLEHPALRAARGIALSSPLLGLKIPVPKYKESLARLCENWVPTLTMSNEIRYEDLSRNPEQLKAYASDPLRHDRISPKVFLGMLSTAEKVLSHVADFQLPILMQIAGDDRIVNAEASRKFYDSLKTANKEFIVYAQSLHEIFNDLDRETALADLKKFLKSLRGRG